MPTAKTAWVDFKEIKTRVSIVQILERYGVLEALSKSGNDRLSGACPIHGGTNTTHFRVSISKNCWNCFGKCQCGGNVIDFVSKKEDVSFRDAALLIRDWFIGEQEETSVPTENPRFDTSQVEEQPRFRVPDPTPPEESPVESEEIAGNKPLKFALTKLDPTHEYLRERGLSEKSIATFGLGYCGKGLLRGYIAIPIHSTDGELVAYAGRWPGARKYRVGLVLAHQELRQLERDPEVASAVLSNSYTRIVFRVGDADAKKLAEGFSAFGTEDIQGLGVGEAICRVERSDFDFNLSVPLPDEPDAAEESRTRERVIDASRKAFATPRAEVEAVLRSALESQATTREPKREERQEIPPAQSPKDDRPVEIKPPPSLPEEKKESKAPAAIPDMGRGGAQHQTIQQRLKAVAEGLGFRATVEKQVLDGQGSIDLALEKPGLAIACEINVTSTIDYEVGNASKCLKAGFSKIAVICPSADRLSRLAEAMKGCFSPEQASKIGFYSPDDFISYLQTATLEAEPSDKPAPTEERRRGYKVKRSFVQLSPEEAKAREDSALKMLAEKMRRKI